MNKLKTLAAVAALAATFAACSKSTDEPLIIVPPSDGSSLTLNGIAGAEDGAAAANSVYVDFSADKQSSVLRDSWDLGFYSGTDFKVIINASNGASALVVNKTDLNAVTAADFDPNALKVGQGTGVLSATGTQNPATDDPRESSILNKTVIATISATDADNKVYIINRKGGTGTVLANDELYKVRILRKGTGYTLQYAKVTETTFKTLDVAKNAEVNFQFASLVKGSLATVEPNKAEWDLVWGYSMYYTATFPYAFSDLVFINNLGGVTAAKVATSFKSYADFTLADSKNAANVVFSNARDIIGSSWRATTGTVGVKMDIFYAIKDAAGNVYKLKFVSFHAADGGTRGKPVIEYKLLK